MILRKVAMLIGVILGALAPERSRVNAKPLAFLPIVTPVLSFAGCRCDNSRKE